MKIAVVTGASSGMGRETIIQLWEHFKGFDEIWIIARRRERLDELDRQVGVPLRKFALDLTRERDRDVLLRALSARKPQVKFLVNAAGFGMIGQVEELGLKSETDMVALNCEALCAVTRNEEIGLWHQLSEDCAHLRISCSDNGSNIAVCAIHTVCTPLYNFVCNQLVNRSSIDKFVLKLTAGRVGCLYQNKDSLVLCLAHIYKRLHAIGSEIRVYSEELGVECRVLLASNLHFTQMSGCVCSGSRTDITALCIADHDQSLLLAVANGALVNL
jgi:hypothetical protein